MVTKVKSLIATVTISVIVCGGVSATSSAAFAAGAPSGNSVTENITSISAQDWREIADRAESAGDKDAARIAYAEAAKGSGGASTMGVGGAVKSSIKILLKYGKDKLPASIRPYADKLLRVLDSIDNWAEGTIAAGLQSQGLDPNTATQVAHYAVIFINTFG